MDKSEKHKIVNSLNSIASLRNRAVGDYAKGSASMALLVIELLSNRSNSEAYKQAYYSLKQRAIAAKADSHPAPVIEWPEEVSDSGHSRVANHRSPFGMFS